MNTLSWIVGIIIVSILFLEVHHVTHNHTGLKPSSKQVVQGDTNCFPKEALDVVAVNSSKKTVDFIVDKMLTDKFIIVNKDGMSYRFKLVKKYKIKK